MGGTNVKRLNPGKIISDNAIILLIILLAMWPPGSSSPAAFPAA